MPDPGKDFLSFKQPVGELRGHISDVSVYLSLSSTHLPTATDCSVTILHQDT